MKRIHILVICQVFFSFLQAYLISRISLIGRIGIATIHKEYALLRSGWKTFLLIFGIQLAIILLLAILQKKVRRKTITLTASILIALAVLGLLYTYYDFQYTFSHKLLKERFHLGFYLFWLGWISSCIFFIVTANAEKKEETIPWPEDKNSDQILG